MSTYIVDNGAGKIKAGLATQQVPISMTNATAKIDKSMQYLIGDDIDNFNGNGSLLQLTRPFDRGYINNWKCQTEIWDNIFTKIGCKPLDSRLIITEPPLNPESIQNDMNEIIFEYYGFQEYLRKPSVWFSAYSAMKNEEINERKLPFCTIVDSGFSFSHSVPFVDYRCVRSAIRRLNIGGKLLTNYLKELVSYRQWNMMDEFLLINEIKEKLCYVSDNMFDELKSASKFSRIDRYRNVLDPAGGYLKKSYVLPDFHHISKGHIKPDDEAPNPYEQLLIMETERLSIPELLFNPMDVGLNQAGLPETTVQSLKALKEYQASFASKTVVLTGGNMNLYNLKNRYYNELRPQLPDLFELNVYQPNNPELFAWYSAQKYYYDVQNGLWENEFLKKSVYEEYGHGFCNNYFNDRW